MGDIDTNINNYSITELMMIIDIPYLNEDDVIEKTDFYIHKFAKSNPKLASFFADIQDKLMDHINETQNYEPDPEINFSSEDPETYSNPNSTKYQDFEDLDEKEAEINEWISKNNLEQDDPIQTSKITDRTNKVQTFEDTRFPMKREQLATTDMFNLPVKQDTLNPNLKNTINRFINLDSQFRQFSSGADSQPTNYTCDLSDTLKNTVKLSLYSYQIPYSWYVIDTVYGNTCLWIKDVETGIVVPVSIKSGNYNQTQFQTALNNAFIDAGFSNTDTNNKFVNYDENNGKISLTLLNAVYNGILGNFTVSTTTQIIFYDFSNSFQCQITCSNKNHYFNNTLCWIMGYRTPYIQVEENGNDATCVLNLNGTKYLILVIDDYNQNHVNNSLVSISKYSNTLKVPTYYSPDLPRICVQEQGNNLDDIMAETQNGLLIAGKYQEDYTTTQTMLPSAPRTLTNAQLYTINSINNNNNNLTNYLTYAPTSADILAIIPVKTSSELRTGTLLVEFSGSLQDNCRTYFGPVDIERMAVKLLDDKGNVLNLNGSDWCVTMIADCLYQY